MIFFKFFIFLYHNVLFGHFLPYILCLYILVSEFCVFLSFECMNEPREQKWLKKARQKQDFWEVDEEAVTVSKSWCPVNWSHSRRQTSKVTLGNAFPQTHFPLSHGESRPGFVYSSR